MRWKHGLSSILIITPFNNILMSTFLECIFHLVSPVCLASVLPSSPFPQTSLNTRFYDMKVPSEEHFPRKDTMGSFLEQLHCIQKLIGESNIDAFFANAGTGRSLAKFFFLIQLSQDWTHWRRPVSETAGRRHMWWMLLRAPGNRRWCER